MYGRCTVDLRLDIVPISYHQRKEPYVFTTDIVCDSYPISYDIVHGALVVVTGPQLDLGIVTSEIGAYFNSKIRPISHSIHRYRKILRPVSYPIPGTRYRTRYRTIERNIAYDLRRLYASDIVHIP